MARNGTEPCTISGCEKHGVARGWCSKHYSRWSRLGDPEASVRERLPNANGASCGVGDCPKPVQAKGLCPKHYRRYRLYGDPLAAPETAPSKTLDQLREDAFTGAAGGHASPSGYRYRTLGRGRRFAEHRLVMEHILGRALYPDETVHHRNGERSDNRPENLELWSSWQPSGQRVTDKVAGAREVLARYC